MEEEKEVFEYTYSAPTEREKKQIESIRRQYAPKADEAETAFDRLKRLNAKVYNAATRTSLIFGVVGILIFGLGLTMVLEWGIWLWGIVTMTVGCVPVGLAYPIYRRLLARGKRKYGEEILRLSDELLKR